MSVDVTNTGSMAGKEIVQVYVHHEAGLVRPEKGTWRFAKVALEPGEAKTVSIPLNSALAFYHPEYKQWITEDGDFDLLIAASAADIRHTLTVSLTSSLKLPCILDKESTVREWLNDPRGQVVFGPMYAQMEEGARAMFGGTDANAGNEGAIGMDIMIMFDEMPLVSVLMFQQNMLPQHPEDIVAGMLQQVHAM
ncbi:MAG: fibronectin type III-like domain-contianing protein [Caldilineaceae bacterium]